jgi:hypothetical protein
VVVMVVVVGVLGDACFDDDLDDGDCDDLCGL